MLKSSGLFPSGRVLCWLLAALLALPAGCSHPADSSNPGILTNLRFSPSAFDSFKRNAELRFTLKLPVTLSVSIIGKDAAGGESPVKTLIVDARETAGSHAITWLGDNEAKFFAPAGVYFGVVRVDQQAYETTVQVFHF